MKYLLFLQKMCVITSQIIIKSIILFIKIIDSTALLSVKWGHFSTGEVFCSSIGDGGGGNFDVLGDVPSPRATP